MTFNVVMGSAQELKARASVDALAQLQVPHARVRRDGAVEEVESTRLVRGSGEETTGRQDRHRRLAADRALSRNPVPAACSWLGGTVVEMSEPPVAGPGLAQTRH